MQDVQLQSVAKEKDWDIIIIASDLGPKWSMDRTSQNCTTKQTDQFHWQSVQF